MKSKVEANPNILIPQKNVRVWWELTRPHTLTAGFVPVTLGTALAYTDGVFHVFLFLAMLLASLLIQAATNMFNEYYDYKRGLDNEESVGIGGAIVRYGVKAETVLNIAFSFFGVAALLGVYICLESSWWVAVVGIICMVAGYLYTGGPYPIAYSPFGELVAGFFMGTVIILISYYIQTGTVTTESVLASVPIFILIGGILLANNIRDLDGDKENGRKTVAILIGRKRAIFLLAYMFIFSYGWVIGLVLIGGMTPWLLLMFLSLPKAVAAVKGFIGKSQPSEMMPAMKATAQTNTFFGFLLTVGLIVSSVV